MQRFSWCGYESESDDGGDARSGDARLVNNLEIYGTFPTPPPPQNFVELLPSEFVHYSVEWEQSQSDLIHRGDCLDTPLIALTRL